MRSTTPNMSTPVFMNCLPPGCPPRVYLRDDIDRDAVDLQGGRLIMLNGHLALIPQGEEMVLRLEADTPWEEACSRFNQEFRKLLRQRIAAHPIDDDLLAYVQWSTPCTQVHSTSKQNVVFGEFGLWVGLVSALHPVETGVVNIKDLPEFNGSHNGQTDIEVPFTWDPDERLDRCDVIYRAEV